MTGCCSDKFQPIESSEHDEQLINDRSDIEEEDKEMPGDDDQDHSESGGSYSHLWSIEGTVTSVSDESIIIEQGGGEEKSYAIDTRTAEEYGRMPLNIEVGSRIKIDYFLYDKKESTILAQAIYIE